jgi:ssDNA thymidine ADP-ribosyltransferase, DarT
LRQTRVKAPVSSKSLGRFHTTLRDADSCEGDGLKFTTIEAHSAGSQSAHKAPEVVPEDKLDGRSSYPDTYQMLPTPKRPKIYHITHVDNLQAIIASKRLISDARLAEVGGPSEMVGMSHIKQRRLTEISLDECYPDDYVGQYVPFYFCPRSVMLYLIHMRNHELTYKGGQGPIVHLEADLHSVIQWAEGKGRRWAFSLSNAGSYVVEFRNQIDQLNEVNWPAVSATDWRNSATKHGKQAEFLIRDSFPWHLVDRIGVYSNAIAQRASQAIATAEHQPQIEILQEWYY